MKEIFPNYYKKFRCIADRCRHSCCIGWEIDIDDDTMALYNSLEGEFGERIRSSIEGEVPHFVLGDGERCPFLNCDGLCDIICNIGYDAICDICHLHPRFSNFYDDFTETGLGLCCEEAARIILTEKEKFAVALPEGAENNEFFRERGAVLDILQDRSVSFAERFGRLCGMYRYDCDICGDELYDLYMSLERLDASWETELEKLKGKSKADIFDREEYQIFFEQLACYFVFRHFERGIGFMLVGCYVIGLICSECTESEQMIDIARMYSSEIEYCEENADSILDFFESRRTV